MYAFKLTGTVMILFAVLISSSIAEIPKIISYQGRLVDDSDQPVNGSKLIKFTIYDSLFGDSLWSTGFQTVQVVDGLFSYNLGSDVTLWEDVFTGDDPRYLGITIDPYPETEPRTQIKSVPYAYHAAIADSAKSAPLSIDSDWVVDGDDVYRTTGDVGIGTSSPDARLHVNGALRLGTGSREFELKEVSADDPADWSQFIEYDGVAIASEDGGNRQMFMFTDGSNQNQIFTVATSQNSGSTWEADFIIEQDGDVGIGVINPTASLEVGGDAHIYGKLTWDVDTGYISINPLALRPRHPISTQRVFYNESGRYLRNDVVDGSIEAHAGINLPHGATITKLTAYWMDGSTNEDAILSLAAVEQSIGDHSYIAAVSTSGSAGTIDSSSDESILIPEIDNSRYSYMLYWHHGPTVESAHFIYYYGAVIEYTFTRPH